MNFNTRLLSESQSGIGLSLSSNVTGGDAVLFFVSIITGRFMPPATPKMPKRNLTKGSSFSRDARLEKQFSMLPQMTE
jgi:hypothetical protein